MKKTFILLFLGLFNVILFGQEVWAPQGAEWHYGFVRGNPWLNIGYIKIKAIGDTVIQGKTCKILDQTQIRYTFFPIAGYDTSSIGQVITYSDSSKVYTYRNNRFYTLYDFGATVGTIWTVCWNVGAFPDDTGQVQVNGIDYSIINGDTLKTLYVSRVTGSCIGWYSAVIMERMGCINEYMFPDYDESCISDIQIDGYFRCYLDDTFPLYSVDNSDTICEYVLSGLNNEPNQEESIRISPNPVSTYLTIEWNKQYTFNSKISMLNLQGQKILEVFLVNHNKMKIDVSSIKPGLYIINILNDEGYQISRKVIIN